jgi:hypothetical protein
MFPLAKRNLVHQLMIQQGLKLTFWAGGHTVHQSKKSGGPHKNLVNRNLKEKTTFF